MKPSPRLIVSLTSFPARIDVVHLVLESLMVQSMPADDIVLWLSECQFPGREKDLPQTLLACQERGVLIEWTPDDLRPHKKYYYAMQKWPEDVIVTVDDDILCPPNMLKRLWRSYRRWPRAVSTLRTHLMQFDKEGQLLPYHAWRYEYSKLQHRPSMMLFSTSGAGTLYPPHCMHPELFNKASIQAFCLNADDLWLKIMQVMVDTPVVLVRRNRRLPYIDGTQEDGLWTENIHGGQNDVQMRAILEKYDAFPGPQDTLSNRIRRDEAMHARSERSLYNAFLRRFYRLMDR